jgi:lysozyme
MTDMTISAPGLIEIAEHEGIVPAPYLDSAGVWTWGIGHTAAAGGPDPARMHRAMPQDVDAAVMAAIDQFAIDMKGYVARVNAAIRVPLAQHQFDALVSFDFNTGGIHRAKLTAAINAGEPDAARHFMGWLRPPEIRKRRTAEMTLFRTGDYAAIGDAVPVWRTDGRGRLAGVLRTMSGEELLRRIVVAPIPADLPKMLDLAPAISAAARARAAQDAAARALADLEAALAA